MFTYSFTRIIRLRDREREPQILDYQTQQYKLFPVIATSLVYKFAATWLWDEYTTVMSELEYGELSNLPEVNTLLSITIFILLRYRWKLWGASIVAVHFPVAKYVEYNDFHWSTLSLDAEYPKSSLFERAIFISDQKLKKTSGINCDCGHNEYSSVVR